jgi:hypothetical protein
MLDSYLPARELTPYNIGCKFLVAGAVLLAVAVDENGSVGFETQVGAAQLVDPDVFESEFSNFLLRIAQNFPMPEIAGTQYHLILNPFTGYRDQKYFSPVAFRQYDFRNFLAGPIHFFTFLPISDNIFCGHPVGLISNRGF